MVSEGDNSSQLPSLPSYSLLGSLQTVGSGNLKGKTVTSPTTPPAHTSTDKLLTAPVNDMSIEDNSIPDKSDVSLESDTTQP